MQKQPYGFLSLLPLFMVIFIDVMGTIMVFPLLTPLLLQTQSELIPASTSLLMRDFLYGFTLSLFPMFMFFSTPVLGDLSDKFGRKKVLLFCLFISVVGYLVAVLAIVYQSLGVFILSRVLAGLAAGTQPTASAAIIDFSSAKTKTRNLSWVVLASAIGVIIGPLLGGVTADKNIVAWFSYKTPFFIGAFLSFLNAVLLFYFYKEEAQPEDKHPLSLTKGFRLFITAFAESKFRLLSLTCVCYILAWSLYYQAICWFVLKNFHYNSSQLGLFVGFIGVVSVFGTSVVTRFVMNWTTDVTYVYLFFIAAMAVANFGCVLSQSEVAQWLWMIPNAIGDVVCYTITLDLYSNLVGPRSQGWIMGVVGALCALTWTVGGLIMGPLGYVDIRIPIVAAGVLCVIGFFAMIIYRRLHAEVTGAPAFENNE